MPRCVAEAIDLLVLGGEVHDRVEHQLDEPEGPIQLRGGEITDGQCYGIPAGLSAQPGDHGRGQIDTFYGYASVAEGQGEATGADAQLKGVAISGEFGQEPHRLYRWEVGCRGGSSSSR